MKDLKQYISERMNVVSAGTFREYTIDDMIEYGVFIPNDDLSKDDCMKIAIGFYDKYPANENGCAELNGTEVKCDYGHSVVKFTFLFGKKSEREWIEPIKTVVKYLSDTVYGVSGDDNDIKKMIKSKK